MSRSDLIVCSLCSKGWHNQIERKGPQARSFRM
ncbi:MAG: hypothetical protein K6T87_06610 [Roseiflexus sp.]|nr:hypothetical protein [Roseiflexus sp.]